MSCVLTDEFSVRVTKITSRIGATAFLSILNLFELNELWLYFQKHVNQIILNRTTKA